MKQKQLTKKQIKEFEEVLAFGWSKGNLPYYTLRDSIANAHIDKRYQDECIPAFGVEFSELVKMLQANCDLDKKYYADNIFV
jgi:hypothetical protein